MKRIIYSFAIAVLLLSGCSEEFLDTDNLYEKSLENFYQSKQDIEEGLAGAYNSIYVNNVFGNEHVTANLLSDLMLAGGGPDDASVKWIDNFEDPLDNTYQDLWKETYNGVYRSNAIIEAASEADFSPFFKTTEEAEAFKNQALGEAYFIRGFMMFRAAKFFGGMPIIPTTDAPRDVERSSISETFTYILSDFKTAVELLPNKSSLDYTLEEYGHATKWSAQGFLARAFMYYTGYMTNIEGVATNEAALLDGSSLTKAQIVTYLEDCIANSGHELVEDFRNLWPYSYVNERAGSVVLPWADTENLAWAGQDGPHSVNGTGNKEVMFAIRYAYGNWSWSKPQAYTNRVCLHFGIRGNSMVPFGQGWGFGPVNPLLYDEWDDADVRKKGSILELGDAEQGTDGYQANKGDHETGLVNKKYTNLQHDGDLGVKGLFAYLYDMANPNMQLWHAQDFYYLRFADIYLMHAELTEDATYLNKVRERAGLGPVTYSIEALKAERKFEFAFEGIRWYDLVRWGDVDNPSNNYFDNEVDVNNTDGPAKYTVNYRSVTKGLLSIPESEIRLSNGVYEQNPGW